MRDDRDVPVRIGLAAAAIAHLLVEAASEGRSADNFCRSFVNDWPGDAYESGDHRV